MTSKETALNVMYKQGKADAQDLQTRAPDMDGTALYSEKQKIPDFQAAKEQKNMLQRPVGFVCRSTAGRVVKLLQVYDSMVYPGEPEELPAQWGFVWSTNPEDALPFVAMSTSPYGIGECCTENGQVYRSTIDNNVWAPSAYPQGWEAVNAPEQGGTEPGGTGPAPEQGDTEPADEWPEFVQPTGAHDAYNAGDKVTYNGKHYQSTMDGNVWSPDSYPQGWKEVTA